MIFKYRAIDRSTMRMDEVREIYYYGCKNKPGFKVRLRRSGRILGLGEVDLMAFTGLFDKDNDPIWENDILMDTSNGQRSLVRYIEGGFWVDDDPVHKTYHMPYKEYRKVVGNIYSNKDLL